MFCLETEKNIQSKVNWWGNYEEPQEYTSSNKSSVWPSNDLWRPLMTSKNENV